MSGEEEKKSGSATRGTAFRHSVSVGTSTVATSTTTTVTRGAASRASSGATAARTMVMGEEEQTVDASWGHSWARSQGAEARGGQDNFCRAVLATLKAAIERELASDASPARHVSYGLSGGGGKPEVRLRFAVDIPVAELPVALQEYLNQRGKDA